MLKGEFMLNGFIAIKPENEIAKHLQLLNHIRDEEHVARHRAFEDWFKHTQDIPGDFYLWIVERLFRDNALIRGELEVEGRRVDLGAIRCPVNLLAGATRPHHAARPGLRARRRGLHAAGRHHERVTAAATSACSWAARRCATTGRHPGGRVRALPARRRARRRASARDGRHPARQEPCPGSVAPPSCDRRHTSSSLARCLLIC